MPREEFDPSTSSLGSIATEEEEAKQRAKQLISELLQNKAEAMNLRRNLSSIHEENEGLIRVLQDKKYELAREKERHAAEMNQLRKINHELQQKVEASKHEIRKVAQTCAQRTADTAVHLQNKENEVDALEEEVLSLKEQLREARAEGDRLRLEREELERVRGEVPEKAQQRIAELARRILEISKEKSAADQMIMEGNDKVAAAMKTVEEFRQMQRETDARLQETERAREGDRARYEATIRGLQQELEMQTTLYKKYVEKLGQSPSAPSPITLPPIHHPEQQTMVHSSPNTALLESKLIEKDGHIKELQEALAMARQQLEDHWKSSIKEKQSTYEQLRDSQKDSDYAMQQMRQDLEAAQDKIRALLGEKKNFDSLMELYEQVKGERDELRKECFTAAVEAETAKRVQGELNEQVRQQQIDRAAQERLAEELFKEKEAREHAEKQLRMSEQQFQSEMSMKNRQLDMNQESYQAGQKAGRDEAELRVREVEREKAMMQEEMARCRGEVVRLQEQLQRDREELAAKDKEIKDWATAFQTAEKHKISMGAQHDELKQDKAAVQQEKAALELRVNVLQQHVERLEQQLRDEQERAERMAQQHAEKELTLAQREYDYREREMKLREQGARQKELLEREHTAVSAMEKQKVSKELEMLQREADLREKATRREQERLLEQAAQELAAKELEITTLKKELGSIRGQQGQLQSSLNTALTHVASMGHQYAADQAAAAHRHPGVNPRVSPIRTGRSPSPYTQRR